MQRKHDKPVATGTAALRFLFHRLSPVLLVAGWMAAGAQAVELGEMRMHSSAGRQLRASIPLAGADVLEIEDRCFSGVLLNAQGQPAGSLKVVLQRSATSVVLLLAGAATDVEPAVAVRVENTCMPGQGREYPVLLTAAAPAAPAAAIASAGTEGDRGRSVQSQKLQKASAQEEVLSRKLKSLEKRLGTVLSAPGNKELLRAAASAGHSVDSTPLLLKLERSLVMPAAVEAGADTAAWTEQEAGILLLLMLAATGAWMFFHLRERTAPAQWMPPDAAS